MPDDNLHSSSAGDIPRRFQDAVNAYFEKQRRKPKVIKALDAVHRLADEGQVHLHAWEEAYKGFHGRDASVLALAGWHFIVSAGANLQVATLYAAKLVEKSPNSVNVHYLANVLRDAARSHFRTRRQAIELAASGLEEVVRELDPRVAVIKAHRDKEIAHLDRSALNAGLDEAHRADITALRQVFTSLKSALISVYQVFPEYGQPTGLLSEEMDALTLRGPHGLSDLLYFARRAMENDSIPSPSAQAEQVRELFRAFARGEMQIRRARAGSDQVSDDFAPEFG